MNIYFVYNEYIMSKLFQLLVLQLNCLQLLCACMCEFTSTDANIKFQNKSPFRLTSMCIICDAFSNVAEEMIMTDQFNASPMLVLIWSTDVN